jgi:hypothetical protein
MRGIAGYVPKKESDAIERQVVPRREGIDDKRKWLWLLKNIPLCGGTPADIGF